MTEIWKAIPGFEGAYEVSDLGRVRGVDRLVVSANRWGPVQLRWKGKLLKFKTDKDGYLRCGLHKAGVQQQFAVHWLVLLAFKGPCPVGLQSRHLDGIKTHNFPHNLEWGTPSEQHQDKVRHGTFRVAEGENVGNAKLTKSDVGFIRRSNWKQQDLADAYGVTQSLISMIRARKIWCHV